MQIELHRKNIVVDRGVEHRSFAMNMLTFTVRTIEFRRENVRKFQVQRV